MSIEIKLDEDSRIVQALLNKGMSMNRIRAAVDDLIALFIHERLLIDCEDEIIERIEMEHREIIDQIEMINYID